MIQAAYYSTLPPFRFHHGDAEGKAIPERGMEIYC